MSGQWEYLLSHMTTIQSQTFLCFYLLMLQQWNPISNLSSLQHTPSHPLYCPMHTLKRSGGPKVGFGPGVGGVCMGNRGVYTAPQNLTRCGGFRVWPLCGCYHPLLSCFSAPPAPLDWYQSWLSTNTQVKRSWATPLSTDQLLDVLPVISRNTWASCQSSGELSEVYRELVQFLI